ncbi:hypothetical protein SASPL_122301 [Salvia splendens]|uniref:NPH3 domain-containing protein n=1 Tax=Salvia splendens TaxID=180675 RepID=A0A8X8XLW5_SALSN|nr:root phototropism protein 3-like [Salvia splendens]KAG6414924.1 hypothetical protein SASPL_122301 [Salvia splendens]
MWESGDYDTGSPISTAKNGLHTDGFHQRGHSWFVSTDIPSDFLVQIGDITFHLHKFPLLSRCAKMNRIIYESRDAEINKLCLDDLPGGADAFELAAKFCYGVAVNLTATNISGLRCAAEFLEMTEDLEEGNLIFKTEAFLSYVVLSSWRDSIVVLKSCENLSPWAENLQIVRRCSESIAWKACANPKGIRWQYTGKPRSSSNESSPSRGGAHVPPDWWFEDVSILRIDHFVRVVTAIKVKGMRYELIGSAIVHYGSKWLPGLAEGTAATAPSDEGCSISSISNAAWKGGGGNLHVIVAGNQEFPTSIQAKDQRMIVESLISIIPQQRDCVSCSFLLRLLRMANMLKVAPALVTELEKRVGMQFEHATLSDLLIPCFNTKETIYDVDLVQRLLEHFLVQEQSEGSSPTRHPSSDLKMYDGGSQRGSHLNGKMRVARLVDSYLTEVARDRNLSLTKFQVLAEALPESARTCDDGLYRAVDSYLKAHPTLTEHERKRLCRVMECQKLSMDACMHAAQNERLPLRVVVQVLFSEQMKISNAVALKEGGESQYQPMVPNRKTLLEGTPQSFQEGWTTAKKDINTLKFEVESVKAKYLELQNEMEALQRELNKLAKPKQTSAWTSGWKKLSKFTKMTEANDTGSQVATADHTRKTPRRWRNSIS